MQFRNRLAPDLGEEIRVVEVVLQALGPKKGEQKQHVRLFHEMLAEEVTELDDGADVLLELVGGSYNEGADKHVLEDGPGENAEADSGPDFVALEREDVAVHEANGQR